MPPESITLHDTESGNQASILVGYGFNCYSFRSMCDGTPREVLWSHPNFASGEERPSGSGIPILFPFAGRIPGARFEYQGKHYELEAGDGQGNAIHGFVMQRPWRLVEHSDTRAVGEFQASVDAPDVLDRWPADFLIRVGYELRGGGLASDLHVECPGPNPLPFGLATHAYFRVPPAEQGKATDCVVQAPVSQYWEMENLIPTGVVKNAADLTALAEGLTFDQCDFDTIFSGLGYEGNLATTSIHNPTTGHTLKQTFDDAFGYCVVYNPPHREAICMEPYTALPNAFQLSTEGIETGLRVLEPGETFDTLIEIALD